MGSSPLMRGKICLVTGATAGIGEVTARELARLGASVIVVGRNRERCAATVESIRRETGNSAVEAMVADLSAQVEVRRLASEFTSRYQRLDVLINNAGAFFEFRRESVDGIEMTLALNHLAYFLLTNLLLDMLKASAPSRIVIVSSEAHRDAKSFDFDDPERRLSGLVETSGRSLLYTFFRPLAHPGLLQYAQSKLANLLFTYELARRLAGTGVTVNALHPGFVYTRFSAGAGPYTWFMRQAMRLIGTTPERGATTTVHLATSPDLANVTGQYFIKEKPAVSSPASHDADAARRLWELSERMTGLRGRAGGESAGS